MNIIKFAAIGTGMITEKFISEAEKVDGFKLHAMYSREEVKAREFAEKYRAETIYTDLNRLSQDRNIDAVYIASPNSLHFSQVMKMLSSGKHVLCEKSIASNLKEAERLYEEARKNNLVLLEELRTLHDPKLEIIKRNFAKLGNIRGATINFCQYSSKYDAFKNGERMNIFNLEYSAGALMDIGVYCVNIMLELFGYPETIKSESVMLRGDIDGAGTIIAGYNDKIVNLHFSKITNSYLPSEIIGENGSMLIQNIVNPSDVRIKYNNQDDEEIYMEKYAWNIRFAVKKFIDFIDSVGKDDSELIYYNNISMHALKIMDSVRAENGIIFPADSKELFEV
ncbi:MAG: Gfo/Idh/MocA family protein [Suipraeoptans sp.]